MPRTTFSDSDTPVFSRRAEAAAEFASRTERDSDAKAKAFELAARRTGMSFQRTRLSADRTLMAVIRTALSLITFGFTIYHFFLHLRRIELLDNSASPRGFAAVLVSLGVVMLISGIGYQLAFMRGLRRQRIEMRAAGLIHGESQYPVSLSLLVAVALLVLGGFAFVSMFDIGPLG